jgi:hypothetical protein
MGGINVNWRTCMKRYKRTVTDVYSSSKIRITKEDKENPKGEVVSVYRFTVDYLGDTLHANVSAEEALEISESIYETLPKAREANT